MGCRSEEEALNVLLIGIRMISCRRVPGGLMLQFIHRYAMLNPNEVQLSELIYSAVMLVTELSQSAQTHFRGIAPRTRERWV